MDPLRPYGWDAHFAAALTALGAADLQPARVVEEQRGMYRIVTARGERRAEAAGRLRREGDVLPAVGDWVAVQFGTAETARNAAGALTAAEVDDYYYARTGNGIILLAPEQ